MKTRSPFEICLPLVIFAVASLTSLPTVIIFRHLDDDRNVLGWLPPAH